MATYFHGGPEIQANTNPSDHLQTLYLMNPNYFSYSDNNNNNSSNNNDNCSNNNNNNPPNMLFINHSGGQNALLHHAPPPHQQLMGIPLAGTHTDSHLGRPSSSATLEIHSSLHGLGVPRVHYNLWGPTMDPSPAQHGPIQTGSQGLSLSLSPKKAAGTTLGDDGRVSVSVAAAGGSCLSSEVRRVVLGSKYLKAAQELLDEVVNVGDINKGESSGVHKGKVETVDPTSGGLVGCAMEAGSTTNRKLVEQLTPVQRQELQMKKVKLVAMLDEVEQRYKQYHTQMKMVISFFEQAAGISSAKSYTSIALKTISRQFRNLKDAITSQIKSTSKSLGEDGNIDGGSGEGGIGSRLKFVDHQLRHQRALQQMGMMQHNAWRPQRGLPERAVSVLRAWLFEHFLHPYPKDSDKHMLAKQTGLTRSQVSNWFINARVRLWKPMVEEMYAEEVKTQETNLNNGNSNNNNNTEDTTTTTTNPETTNPSINDQNKNNSSSKQPPITRHQQDLNASITHHTDHHSTNNHDMITAMPTTSFQGFSLIGSSSGMESLMGRSPKKQRTGSEVQESSPSSILSMDMEMKPLDNNHQTNKYTQDNQRQASIINNGSGFNPYLVQEMGRFNPDPLATHPYTGNGVSLTLGLPHCENLSLGNHQQDFISQSMNLDRRLDIGANEAEFCGISMGQQPSHLSNSGYDSIDVQSRTRFAAHLLHDFVA